MDALAQQLNFILELDKLKAVYRQALVKADNNRQENSAEHSWHIAMLAPVLQEHVAEEVDLLRVIKMLLIHDIVEIDAGDTFAFSEQGDLDAQHGKELAAANRIFGLLPESQFQEYRSLWLEFEEATTADARFAKAMDRILPLLQNMQNEGGSWAKHGVKKSQVLKRNQYLEVIAPAIWQYVCAQIEIAVNKGWLKDQQQLDGIVTMTRAFKLQQRMKNALIVPVMLLTFASSPLLLLWLYFNFSWPGLGFVLINSVFPIYTLINNQQQQVETRSRQNKKGKKKSIKKNT